MISKFLSFYYRIPKMSSKHRVYIWRTLKFLGSISLSQGSAILPETVENIAALKKLQCYVEENGGSAIVAFTRFSEENDMNNVIKEFNRMRSEEYEELTKECVKLIFEIDWLIENEKYRFSELEENEEELKKLNNWFIKIQKRDYYKKSDSIKESKEMLAKAGARLKDYSNFVYNVEKY